MKTLNFSTSNEIFASFVLTNNEMINVRGGSSEGEPTVMPTTPPVKI
jgi:hypothetical protein